MAHGQSSNANAKIFEIESNYRKTLRGGNSQKEARSAKQKAYGDAIESENSEFINPIKKFNIRRNLYYKYNDEKINNLTDE